MRLFPVDRCDALLVQAPNVVGTMFNLPGVETPLNLCYIASYLEKEGGKAEIFDGALFGDWRRPFEECLRATRPALVGFTSYTPNVMRAAEMAEFARRVLPGVATVIGGFHASALPERTLREFPSFDYLIAGEGEIPFTALARGLAGGRTGEVASVAGLTYREGGRIVANPAPPLLHDLDVLPWPAREKLPLARYVPDPGNYYTLPSTGIVFSRGCPLRCTFCSKSVFADEIRYRGVKDSVQEMLHCRDRWGIADFRFFDEGPTVNKKLMTELCEEILRQGLEITWNCFSRVDVIDKPTLQLMKEAGCYHIKYGVEAGTPEMLAKIDKAITLEQAVQAVRWTKQVGIETKANYILALPDETEAQIRETIRFAKKLNTDLVTFNLFKPLPGSPLYRELEEKGELIHESWADYFTTSDAKVFSSQLGAEALHRILKWAWFEYYFRPSYVALRLRRLLRDPKREALQLWTGMKFFLGNLFA